MLATRPTNRPPATKWQHHFFGRHEEASSHALTFLMASVIASATMSAMVMHTDQVSSDAIEKQERAGRENEAARLLDSVLGFEGTRYGVGFRHPDGGMNGDLFLWHNSTRTSNLVITNLTWDKVEHGKFVAGTNDEATNTVQRLVHNYTRPSEVPYGYQFRASTLNQPEGFYNLRQIRAAYVGQPFVAYDQQNHTPRASNTAEVETLQSIHLTINTTAYDNITGNNTTGGGLYLEDRADMPTVLETRLDEYDLLVIGSQFNQSAFATTDMLLALDDWIKNKDGMMVVLASETGKADWLEYLVPGIMAYSANGGTSANLEGHHAINRPAKIDPANIDASVSWDWSDVPWFTKDKFDNVLQDESGRSVLSLSRPGELGYRGRIAFLGLEDPDGGLLEQLFVHRSISQYRTLTYGSDAPEDVPTSSAVRISFIQDEWLGSIPVRATMLFWWGLQGQAIEIRDDYFVANSEESIQIPPGLIRCAEASDGTCKGTEYIDDVSYWCYEYDKENGPRLYENSTFCAPEEHVDGEDEDGDGIGGGNGNGNGKGKPEWVEKGGKNKNK